MKLTALLLLCIFLAGCVSTATAKMGDHRLSARPPVGGTASFSGNDNLMAVTIDGKIMSIMPTLVMWRSGKSVPLPDEWKKLEVREVDSRLVVIVDGQTLNEPGR